MVATPPHIASGEAGADSSLSASALSSLAVFRAVPRDVLQRLLAGGHITGRSYERDDIISVLYADPTDRDTLVVGAGQVGVAVVPEGVDPEAELAAQEKAAAAAAKKAAAAKNNGKPKKKKAKKLRKGDPRIKESKQHLAIFAEGQVITRRALATAGVQRAWLYAATPTTVLTLAQAAVGALKRNLEGFALQLEDEAYTAKQFGETLRANAQEESVFDFFMRHGYNVATKLKVRYIDRCLDCDDCEDACRDRHGMNRLSRKGTPIGLLDFTLNCRSCSDPRCTEVCASDSIWFDQKLGEVVIDDSCTGCNLCAKACCYGSIQMVERADIPAGKLGALPASTDGEAPKKAKLKRFAVKCDHCYEYDDMACVSVCPTEALVTTTPLDLFRSSGLVASSLNRIPRPAPAGGPQRAPRAWGESFGWAPPATHTPYGGNGSNGASAPAAIAPRPVRIEQPAAVMVFTAGGLPEDSSLRKTRRQFWSMIVLVGLVTAGFALEAIARSFPSTRKHTIAYALEKPPEDLDVFARNAAVTDIKFRSGEGMGRALGYGGLLMMMVAGLYPALRRRGLMARFPSLSRTVFNMHVVAGLTGPMWILIHSGVQLDSWVALGLLAMTSVVVTGLTGRYLFPYIPGTRGEREVERAAIRKEVSQLTRELEYLHAAKPAFLEELSTKAARTDIEATGQIVVGSLWTDVRWLLVNDLRALGPSADRRRVVNSVGTDEERKRVAQIYRRLRLLRRREMSLSVARRVLKYWRLIHISSTITLSVVAVVHVAIEVSRTGF